MKELVAQVVEPIVGEKPPVTRPKRKEFGHFAVPVFKYAKERGVNPAQFAQQVAEKLEKRPEFKKVEPVGGFVNIRLSPSLLNRMADEVLKKGGEFGRGERKGRVLLEYLSANPTGPLHIGHGRGAVLGDSLTRIGRHLGWEVVTEYYINDAGRQIYLLGLSIYLAGRELLGKEVTYPEEYYRGEYIRELAQKGIEELGSDLFEKPEGEAVPQLAEWGKEQMLEEIKKDIQLMGLTPFDNWVSEKELYRHWEEVKAELEKRGALYEKEGKIWLRSSKYGDDKDRVVVREDGRPTYLAGDIIYHWYKFRRGFDHYINIWGADHHGYIARLKGAIKFLGHDPDRLEILLSQMVKLLKGGEPYKMSKRAGNFILVRDVVQDVGADPFRFIFLTKKSDTHLEFDVEELKREDPSNPAYYINYAYARIRSIFRKKGIDYLPLTSVEITDLTEEEEQLLFDAFQLPAVLEEAFENREPHRVTNYLYDLASQFHSFYNRNRILGDEREEVRLKIAAVVATILKLGLNLLGINPKERM